MEKKKILLIDDEKGFTDMLSLNLEITGKYQVRVVNKPEHALLAASQYRPDLVLLDIIMPNMEGPDIAIRMKNDKELKNIPIVFLTATVTKEEVDAQKGLIGGRRFVAKPSKLSDLLKTIDKTIAFSEE